MMLFVNVQLVSINEMKLGCQMQLKVIMYDWINLIILKGFL